MKIHQVLNGDANALVTAILYSAEDDIIEVGGDFPDIKIAGPRFTKTGNGVRIQPAKGHGHTFRTITIAGCDRIHLRTLNIRGGVVGVGANHCSVKFCRIGGLKVTPAAIRLLQTKALSLNTCTHWNIVGNTVKFVGTGFSFVKCSDLLFDLNAVSDFRADAHRGYASNLTIRRSIVTDLYRNGGEHVDAAQTWTTGVDLAATPHDILVEDNWFERGNGDAAQGIFLANENRLPVTNVTVRRNMSGMGQWNAIFVNDSLNVSITDNILQGWTDAVSNGQVMVPRIDTRGCVAPVMSGNVSKPALARGALAADTTARFTQRAADIAALVAARA